MTEARMGPAPESAQQVLRACVNLLNAALPVEWFLTEQEEPTSARSKHVDAVLRLEDPAGSATELIVSVKRVVERRDLGRIRDQLVEWVERSGGEARGLVAARYLAPPVRSEIERLGLAYIDAAGNMRVELDRPAVFLSARVIDRDPWRGPGRPRGSLKGEPAARVVRTLVDYADPLSISDIVKLSGASTGATYRVRDYLMEEGLLEPQSDGRYQVPDWARLLREWAEDSGTSSETSRSFIAPRGIESIRAKIRSAPSSLYAVTGSLAAEEWAPYAPAKLARIYVEDIGRAAERLGLRETDAGQNVILVEPKAPRSIVFENTMTARDGLVLAAPSQVAADLLNGPGRNPAEGEALIDWMTSNEDVWRR